MSARIDEIVPPSVGEERIRLQLAVNSGQLLAHVPFQIDVDYSRSLPEGITLPLELIVQGPNAGQYERRLFTRARPSSLLVTPRSGGRHFILLRELFHMHWQGQLFVDVEGEDLQQIGDRT